jgi:uncharacterized protein YndB with AHSA1/START domain
VDQRIKINAPPSDVWSVLTERAYTDQWAREFSRGGPEFHIESSWKLGAPVLWKDPDGTSMVEGVVTRLEPPRRLHFTVADARIDGPKFSDEDGIDCEILEQGRQTMLHVRQGDFATVEEGEKYCQLSDEIWSRVLPRMKRMAEARVH